MRSALITGIAGFFGRALSSKLRSQGVTVTGIVRNPAHMNLPEKTFCGDIKDKAFIIDLVNKIRPEVVFHLAANKTRTGDIKAFRPCIEDNLIGTLNLAEICIGKPYIQRFVAIGACEEYGHSSTPFLEDMRESPVSAYSFSKTAATHLLQTLYRTHQLPVVVLRPALAYGPGQGTDMFLPALIHSLFEGKAFPMSYGQQTRDYVYIDDVIEAMILAATLPRLYGKVINIGSCVPVLLKDMALLVARKIGAGAETLIEFGKKDYRPSEIMEYVASYKAAERYLRWKPHVSLDDGLTITIEHYRQIFDKLKHN